MPLFKGRYRIDTSRLPGWDYTRGWYFVTICTAQRRHFFGAVVDSAMQLSVPGGIVAEEWQRTADVRPYVTLGAWVVMPNHVHAIIAIHAPDRDDTINDINDINGINGINVETSRRDVSTSSPSSPSSPSSSPSPPSSSSVLRAGSLGAIIGQFKSVATKRIWAAGFADFGWQARFYDTIIRHERALHAIQAYIMANPGRWAEDHDRKADLWM